MAVCFVRVGAVFVSDSVVLFLSLQFTGLSVTSGVDQMVALHTSSQDDVLLCLQRGELCPNQDRVGELVGTLVDYFTRSVPQPDTMQTSLSLSSCFLLGWYCGL